MRLVIIKYNAGNIQSVIFAIARLGIEPVLSDDPELIRSADKVIFPGQGEASTAMRYLQSAGLDKLLPDLKQPVLGICLGLQLMYEFSEENDTPCLGILPGKVRRFPSGHAGYKIPQVGWNMLGQTQGLLFEGVPEQPYVYFLHSYYGELNPYTCAQSHYILPFCASAQKNNFYATQFHPEKSGEIGSQILKNFIEKSA